MAIKRCNYCWKGFSTKRSKFNSFCSTKCKTLYDKRIQKNKNNNSNGAQLDFDLVQKQKDLENDFRLSRRRI